MSAPRTGLTPASGLNGNAKMTVQPGILLIIKELKKYTLLQLAIFAAAGAPRSRIQALQHQATIPAEGGFNFTWAF